MIGDKTAVWHISSALQRCKDTTDLERKMKNSVGLPDAYWNIQDSKIWINTNLFMLLDIYKHLIFHLEKNLNTHADI